MPAGERKVVTALLTAIKGSMELIEDLGPARTRLQRAVGRGLTKFVGSEAKLEALKRARGGAGRDGWLGERRRTKAFNGGTVLDRVMKPWER